MPLSTTTVRTCHPIMMSLRLPAYLCVYAIYAIYFLQVLQRSHGCYMAPCHQSMLFFSHPVEKDFRCKWHSFAGFPIYTIVYVSAMVLAADSYKPLSWFFFFFFFCMHDLGTQVIQNVPEILAQSTLTLGSFQHCAFCLDIFVYA